METKFGQIKKLKYPNFVNCPNFVTIFCRVSKMKILISIKIMSFAIYTVSPCLTSILFNLKKLSACSEDGHYFKIFSSGPRFSWLDLVLWEWSKMYTWASVAIGQTQ